MKQVTYKQIIMLGLMVGLLQPKLQAQKAMWDTPAEIRQWIQLNDPSDSAGVEDMSEGSRSFVRIHWKMIKAGLFLRNPADPNFEQEDFGSVPSLLNPNVYNAVKITARHVDLSTRVFANWRDRATNTEDITDLPHTTVVPSPADNQWQEIVLSLTDSPFLRTDADIIQMGIWFAGPALDNTKPADVEQQWNTQITDASHLDIDRIEFLHQDVSIPDPMIVSMTPTRGKHGTVVTLRGSGFGTPFYRNVIVLGQFTATPTSGDANALTFVADVGGAFDVSVLVPGGKKAVAPMKFVNLGDPAELKIQSGDGQQGAPGTSLQPLTVKVVDSTGEGLPDIPIKFRIASGSGTLSVPEANTDNNGVASTVLSLGSTPGIVTVEAETQQIVKPMVFTLRVIP